MKSTALRNEAVGGEDDEGRNHQKPDFTDWNVKLTALVFGRNGRLCSSHRFSPSKIEVLTFFRALGVRP